MHAKLDCFGLTDVGLKRKENQDQFLIAEFHQTMRLHQSSLTIQDQEQIQGRSQGQVLIVADGMGGHAGGKRASQLAVETMVHCLLDLTPFTMDADRKGTSADVREQFLRQALDQCQIAIEREGLSMPEKSEMGTTFTMCVLLWPVCYLMHVGDSRAYLLRKGKLQKLTEDQTVAEDLIKKGQIPPSAADSGNALSHMLWGYLGVESESLRPELHRLDLELNDALLVCSDGLSKHLTDDEICQTMKACETAEETCKKLLRTALNEGGFDNITVVVARIRDSNEMVKYQEAEAEEFVRSNEDTQEFLEVPANTPLNELE